MKLPALACALICFFAAAESTQAQELKGLRTAAILIEELDKATVNLGLTEEPLTDQILVALKRDIPKLKIESLGNKAVSQFYLAIVVNLDALLLRTYERLPAVNFCGKFSKPALQKRSA